MPAPDRKPHVNSDAWIKAQGQNAPTRISASGRVQRVEHLVKEGLWGLSGLLEGLFGQMLNPLYPTFIRTNAWQQQPCILAHLSISKLLSIDHFKSARAAASRPCPPEHLKLNEL
eukprot:1157759-Pelagomonas_calceolata.AAC.5